MQFMTDLTLQARTLTTLHCFDTLNLPIQICKIFTKLLVEKCWSKTKTKVIKAQVIVQSI